MRDIKRTAQFRRDFRRVKRGEYGGHVDATLLAALELLAMDARLPTRHVDHPMKGAFSDCRDCHLRPDLVLVYRKVGSGVLELVRIGSHAQLGCEQAGAHNAPGQPWGATGTIGSAFLSSRLAPQFGLTAGQRQA